MAEFQLKINQEIYNIDVEPDTPLLWVLRDHLGLTGTKYSCGMGVCGSCTVNRWGTHPFLHHTGQPCRGLDHHH